jgi:hypothetical protein
MALPSLQSAKYELTLPSTGEKVEYRPFLVKEEKKLLIAQQDNKPETVLKAVEDIVDACTFGKLNAKSLPIFDLEYVFVNLRAKSIGETSKVSVLCPDDKKTRVEIEIDLTKVVCENTEGHSNKIELTDDVGIVMNYPKTSTMDGVDTTDQESAFKIIRNCVGQVYDAENVYEKNDMDVKELDEFLDSLTHAQFEKVQKFFETSPKVRYRTKVKNPVTGVESDHVIEGLNNFF